MIIEVKNLNKYYNDLHVLKNISLKINSGEIISIVGASGAGKTTLLQILGTLDSPTLSKNDKNVLLNINDVNILNLKSNKLAKFRNKNIGFIFQFHQLLPEFTALENVCLPAYIAKKDIKEVQSKAKQLLDYLGLSHRYSHKPNELSGGEQQRVAIARALINEPKIIFADEPSGNLDSENAKQLHNLFLDLRDKFGYTFIIVTHNKELADLSDKKLVMKDGELISQ